MRECRKCGWFASKDTWWGEDGRCYNCEFTVCNYRGCPQQRESADNYYCKAHSIMLYQQRAESGSGQFVPNKGYPTRYG